MDAVRFQIVCPALIALMARFSNPSMLHQPLWGRRTLVGIFLELPEQKYEEKEFLPRSWRGKNGCKNVCDPVDT